MKHRYPGVQPFEDAPSARKLFRGRDDEAYALLQLVLAERLVLVFSRSGLGKSSLVNAGILEPLRERDFLPMVVRVTGASTDPIANIYDGILSAAQRAETTSEVDFEPAAPDWNKTSLWHFFKTIELWRGSTLLSPVLIVDQFEELFTLSGAEGRKRFIHELADLVRGRRPRDVTDPDGAELSDKPPDIRVVLVLREEFYANLQEMRERIPQIYKAPFRLEPLSRKAARAAIAEPAALKSPEFDCPPFTWENDALQMVLDFLSQQRSVGDQHQKSDEVEPFQLQLICRHVEDRVREKGLTSVSRKFLGGPEELKRILSDFYEDTLDRICREFPKNGGLREQLHLLCENGLVSASGRRLLREESEIAKTTAVGPDILRKMVEMRLLRKEPRVGDNYYELTHDTLIEPIFLSRQRRQDRQRAQRRRKNTVAASLVAAGLIGLSAFLAYETFTNRQLAATASEEIAALETERQKADADRQRAEAEKDAVSRQAEQTERKLLETQEELAENTERQKVSKAETQALKIASARALIDAEVQAARSAVLEAEQAVQKHLVQLDEARAEVANAEELAQDAAEGKFQAGADAEMTPQEQAELLLAEANDTLQTRLDTYEVLREDLREARTQLAVAEDKLDAPEAEIANLVQTRVTTDEAPDDTGTEAPGTDGPVQVVVVETADSPEAEVLLNDEDPDPADLQADFLPQTGPARSIAAVPVEESQAVEDPEVGVADDDAAADDDLDFKPAMGDPGGDQPVEIVPTAMVDDDQSLASEPIDDVERARRREARLELAELASLESDIDISDRELSTRYSRFLSDSGAVISPEDRVQAARRLIDLASSADTFERLREGRLATRDAPEGLSLCEAYDGWQDYVPARDVGPESDAKKRVTAVLKRKSEETLTVSTQSNFITVPQRNNLTLDTEYRMRQPVFVYLWANSRSGALPTLEYHYDGRVEQVWNPNGVGGGKRVRVQPNPLRGERSGYRLWTRKNARAPGVNSFLLWNSDGDLVCRRDFEVVE